MPCVTLERRPSGLPIASAYSADPHARGVGEDGGPGSRALERHDGEVARREDAAQRRGVLRPIRERDAEAPRPGDHVRVGDDVAGAVEDDAGTEPAFGGDLHDRRQRACPQPPRSPSARARRAAAIAAPDSSAPAPPSSWIAATTAATRMTTTAARPTRPASEVRDMSAASRARGRRTNRTRRSPDRCRRYATASSRRGRRACSASFRNAVVNSLGLLSATIATSHHGSGSASGTKRTPGVEKRASAEAGSRAIAGARGDRQQDLLDGRLGDLDQRRSDAGGAARAEHAVVERRVDRARELDERRLLEAAERDLRLARPQVPDRDGGHGALAAELDDLEAGHGRRKARDRQVQALRADVLEQAARRAGDERHAHLRGDRREAPQQVRQRGRERVGQVADAQVPDRAPVRLARRALGHVGLDQHAPRLVEHRRAGIGERDVAVRARRTTRRRARSRACGSAR